MAESTGTYIAKAEELLAESLNPEMDIEGKQLVIQKAQVYATLAVAMVPQG